MKTCMPCFTFAAMIVISAAAAFGAQTFEQSVNTAFDKDSALNTQMSTLKQCIDKDTVQMQDSAAQAADAQENYESESVMAGHGGPGGGPGPLPAGPQAPDPGPPRGAQLGGGPGGGLQRHQEGARA